MSEATQYYVKHQKWVTISIGLFLVAVLAVIDELADYRMHISLLYIVPVVLAAWLVGKWAGVYMSIVSAVAWLVVDIRSEIIYTAHIHFWNTTIRLAFFIFVVHGISLLAAAKQKQDELTYFIIHDLKTPLTNIIAGLHTMKGQSDVGDQTKKLLEMTAISSNRMLVLIDSLVDLSKLEGGKFTTRMEDVEVRWLVDRALKLVSLWAEWCEVRLTSEFRTKFIRIQTDAVLVDRVLTNLLSNAIKVSPKGSTILVKVSDIGDDTIIFSVTDQGPGIAPKWHHKIFDKFQQIDARKGGAITGTGLGLTFCRLAVKRLGGEIGLKSDIGKGTIVSFTISVDKSVD